VAEWTYSSTDLTSHPPPSLTLGPLWPPLPSSAPLVDHLPPSTSLILTLRPATHPHSNTSQHSTPQSVPYPGEEGHGSRRHQLKAPQILTRPAVRDSGARLQFELEAGENTIAMEDLLRGTSTKDGQRSHPVPVGIQGLDMYAWVFTWTTSRSAGSPPEDLLWLCDGISHLLWRGLLEQQHGWQEEAEHADEEDEEGQQCAVVSSGYCGGGGDGRMMQSSGPRWPPPHTHTHSTEKWDSLISLVAFYNHQCVCLQHIHHTHLKTFKQY